MVLRTVLIICLSFVLLEYLRAQGRLASQIDPPFGLTWAESAKNIEQDLSKAAAKIVNRQVCQGREAWTVEGLIPPALTRTILYFGTEHSLVEVELQYQHPGWDLVNYEQFLEKARTVLEAKYGFPTVLAHDKKPHNEVTETVVGYQWQLADSSILLFFYSAEQNADVYRTISLHYRAG
jgi:hypothetical protein